MKLMIGWPSEDEHAHQREMDRTFKLSPNTFDMEMSSGNANMTNSIVNSLVLRMKHLNIVASPMWHNKVIFQ